MPDDKKEIVNQISDEALDALLTQWAEDEIAPPAGFHAKTMERLRMEQQNKNSTRQKRNVISFFVQKKKWMSVAAAAVLVLFCIPVVQAQFGGNKVEPIYNSTQKQAQSVNNTGIEEQEDSVIKDQDTMKTEGAPADSPVSSVKNIDESKATPKETQTAQNSQANLSRTDEVNKTNVKAAIPANDTSNQSTITESPTDQNAVTQTIDPQAPAAIFYSMDGEDTAVGNGDENQGLLQQGRSVGVTEDQTGADITSYQASLEELEPKLEKLQKELDENNEKLTENPDDKEIRGKIDDLQEEFDLLKKEIEQLKSLVAEAEEQAKSE